jgi:hypothetical protein
LSTVIISRFESVDDKPVVHVSILQAPVPLAWTNGNRLSLLIKQIAFEPDALHRSLDKLLQTGFHPLPDFEPAYEKWRTGKRTVYKVDVNYAIGDYWRSIGPRGLRDR